MTKQTTPLDLLQAQLTRIDPGITITPVSLHLPPDISYEKYLAVGKVLGAWHAALQRMGAVS
jgi:hypothetical protein